MASLFRKNTLIFELSVIENGGWVFSEAQIKPEPDLNPTRTRPELHPNETRNLQGIAM